MKELRRLQRIQRRYGRDHTQCNNDGGKRHLHRASVSAHYTCDSVLPQTLTNNPDAATIWQVDVHSGEGRQTCTLDVQDVIGTLERIWFAIEVEGEVWETGNRIAVNSVLAVPGPLGTNLGVEHLSNIGGESDQRGAWERTNYNAI